MVSYTPKVSPKEAGQVLPWVHTIIVNAKRTLLGTTSYDI
jgi:hypothetical protein